MRDKENQLAAKMLDSLSDILSNRGCNDFEFPANWSKEEKIKFVKGFHYWNGDPEEFDENNLYMADFSVSSFLAERLRT